MCALVEYHVKDATSKKTQNVSCVSCSFASLLGNVWGKWAKRLNYKLICILVFQRCGITTVEKRWGRQALPFSKRCYSI